MKAILYSYGHFLVITGYKWNDTCYKWGFLSIYNWYNSGHNCINPYLNPKKSPSLIIT